MKFLLLLSVCSLITCLWASPVPSRVRYDQRQEGDLNVRADLENFVILVIPTASGGAAGSSLGLLDLLSKAIPFRSHHGHTKRVKHVKKPENTVPVHDDADENDTDDETQSFIESKTAPYHVDITKSRKNLAKLHPQPVQQPEQPQADGQQEELLVSPNLALVKSEEPAPQKKRSLRVAKGFVLSMPLEVEEDVVHIDNKRIEKSKEDKEIKEVKEEKKKIEEQLKTKEHKPKEQKVKLLLIGAEHEQCGPGYERNERGICTFVEHV